ncbi:MAG: hypothetical protein KF893_04245 [Caldilineaceae bacterium]|nr:hypothetical protein [Caldilineaceae bacterium]
MTRPERPIGGSMLFAGHGPAAVGSRTRPERPQSGTHPNFYQSDAVFDYVWAAIVHLQRVDTEVHPYDG